MKIASVVVGLVVVLAFSAVGCVGPSTVTENDRVMEGHLVQEWDLVDQLGDAVGKMDVDLGKAVKGIAADGKLEAGQLAANHGPAKNQTPYTTANARAAADESKKEHTAPWWKGALIAVGGAVLTMLGLKVGTNALPSLAAKFAGPWGVVGSVGLNVLGSIIQKLETGQPVNAQVVTDTALAHADDADVKDFVAKLLAKAKLGLPASPPGASVPSA